MTTPGSPCTLHAALGQAAACPGVSCPLWNVEAGTCVLAQIQYEIGGRPDFARYLLDLRHELELARARIDSSSSS